MQKQCGKPGVFGDKTNTKGEGGERGKKCRKGRSYFFSFVAVRIMEDKSKLTSEVCESNSRKRKDNTQLAWWFLE
jgi:hypothetical protein